MDTTKPTGTVTVVLPFNREKDVVVTLPKLKDHPYPTIAQIMAVTPKCLGNAAATEIVTLNLRGRSIDKAYEEFYEDLAQIRQKQRNRGKTASKFAV